MGEFVQIMIPGATVFAREHPSECPICHVQIAPLFLNAQFERSIPRIEAFYKCTNKKCGRCFLALFDETEPEPAVSGSIVFLLTKSFPVTQQKQEFPASVSGVSPQFVTIYNEAYSAEQYNLKEICGVGYRKALEFLIKDYLISRIPADDPAKASKDEAIKTKPLGKCIGDDITDANIKLVAQRATWLGNDETHYVRKWETKDVKDLKKLITLTVNHMDSEALTAQALIDMPEQSP